MAKQKLNEVMDRLLMLIRSGYPVIYIVSHEESRVLDYVARIVRVIREENPNKKLFRWYEGVGLERMPEQPGNNSSLPDPFEWSKVQGVTMNQDWTPSGDHDAGRCLRAVREAEPANNPELSDSVVVFHDLHPYLRDDINGSQVRALRNTADRLRRYYDENRRNKERAEDPSRYKTVVVVAPTAHHLSMELERDTIVVDFPLPETDELRRHLDEMLSTNRLRLPESLEQDERNRLCDMIAAAGRGLTLEDYKRGLSMFAVRGGDLGKSHVEDMLGLKAKAINNRALQYTPHVEIELGGLESVKEWVRQRQAPAVSEDVRKEYRLPELKGVMLCGVSGGGKSQLAKYIAKAFNLALLRLDVGALFGSFVGESEERTRGALTLAEVLAPVVLWIDEVDKAFTSTAGAGDNGVSARVFGHFLTWLSEKEDSVFVVTTANDFRDLLGKFPEFARKGRFDRIFWVGLPDRKAREQIFSIYLKPHHKAEYFAVTNQDVDRLVQTHSVTPPEGEDAYDRFCKLLADDAVSTRLTGAEVEHAVHVALFNAYERRNPTTGEAALTPDIVFDAVKECAQEALYRPNSRDDGILTELESEARDHGWPRAGE